MTYSFEVLTQEQAETIAYHWHYDGAYSFYNMTADEEDLAEFLDSESREDAVFAVSEKGEVVGFFSVSEAADRTYDVGLGMRPDLTGEGRGTDFLNAGLEFTCTRFNPKRITLSVATFNQRAISLYRKNGFKDMDTVMQATNGSTYEFLQMVYEC